jgi:site-specific DNA-cytosine methylase
MRVLVACEESQAVCKEFRRFGHDAFSADLLECSGGKPEWHIKGDVLEIIDRGWDMMIAFPPCTHLTVSGARHFKEKRKDGRQQQGIEFFMKMINASIDKIAVENPVGIMSSVFRKPDQIIQPYYFGDPFQKTTCLWLKNLRPLYYNLEPNLFDPNITSTSDKGEMIEFISKTGIRKKQPKWYFDALKMAKTKEERSTLRSKTFPGIAKAMAEQWG